MNMKQAKEKLIQEAGRIDRERQELERRCAELRAMLSKETEPVHGFSVQSIEAGVVDCSMIYPRIQKIEAALKKSYFDDPGFAAAALEYMQQIEGEVQKLDADRKATFDRVDKLKEDLERAEKQAEKERRDIDECLCNLLEPMRENIFSYAGYSYTGAYLLSKLRAQAKTSC